MMLHARVLGITMEGLDDRVGADTDGARPFFSDARFCSYARQIVGITQRPASIGSGTQRR
jgi:hypothetical protein